LYVDMALKFKEYVPNPPRAPKPRATPSFVSGQNGNVKIQPYALSRLPTPSVSDNASIYGNDDGFGTSANVPGPPKNRRECGLANASTEPPARSPFHTGATIGTIPDNSKQGNLIRTVLVGRTI
jgi:hypothetical protein